MLLWSIKAFSVTTVRKSNKNVVYGLLHYMISGRSLQTKDKSMKTCKTQLKDR